MSSSQYFDFQLDYSSYPELAPFKNIVWTTRSVRELEFVFATEWDSISLEQMADGFYALALYLDGEEQQMAIQPVLEGDDYQLALQQFNQQTQQERSEIVKKINEQRQRIESMANIRRLASINKMGIYNYDIWKQMDFDKCEAEILVENKMVTDEALKGALFYLFDVDQRYIVQFDRKTIKEKFVFDPLKKNMVLAILKDGNTAFVDWRVLDAHTKSSDQSSIILNFQYAKTQINSVSDIQQIIDEVFVG